MLRCKQVAEALAHHRYWELPLHRRAALKLHVFLCVFCGRFHRQVILMQDAAHEFLKHEESDPPEPGMRLPAEAKERLRKALAAGGTASAS